MKQKKSFYIDYDDYLFDDKEKNIFDKQVLEQYMSMSLTKEYGGDSNQLELPALTFCYLLQPGDDVIKVDGLEISQMGNPDIEFQEFILDHVEPSKTHEIALCQSIGRRGKMEDTVLVNCSAIEGMDIVGVFDGHNGKEAAIYCTENYVTIFKEQEGDFDHKIKETHRILHEETSKISQSGTTSTVAFIEKETITVAFCGDSPAYIMKENKLKKITKDHKASNEEEVERIQQNGGIIFGMFGVKRVNGQIVVTRSIGDPALHPPLTHEPEYIVLKKEEVDWIFLMSDGISDTVTDSEFKTLFNKIGGGLFNTAFDTLKLAYQNESGDNLTLIVIKIN